MDLGDIKRAIMRDPANSWATQKGYVPVYTASEAARVVFVGQAPGRKAQESATPWNDISGDRLRQWLALSKEDFYDESKIALMPMDFYYPGKGKHGDLPPRKDFAPTWHPLLLKRMPQANLFLLIGRYAQAYYLTSQNKRTLTETVSSYQEYAPQFIPLVHPSPLNYRWLKQNHWFEKEVVPYARHKVHDILQL